MYLLGNVFHFIYCIVAALFGLSLMYFAVRSLRTRWFMSRIDVITDEVTEISKVITWGVFPLVFGLLMSVGGVILLV
jgi:hypothetical protein